MSRQFGPLANVAGRQKGLITRDQMLHLGYSGKRIEVAVRKGIIWQVHRGVYSVGHADLPLNGWELAAVLACGSERTFVSHSSAAKLWGILGKSMYDYREYEYEYFERLEPPWVSVSVVRGQPSRNRVSVRRISNLDECDRAQIDGIPVTSVYRTLLDLARHGNVVTALNNARAKGLVNNKGLAAVIERYPHQHGITSFRYAIGKKDGFSRSKAEDLLSALITKHEFPKPFRNVFAAGVEVDFVWDDHKVVVEVDGFQFHDTYSRFQNDHDRDARLIESDYTVLRFTWKQLTREEDRVVAIIRKTLDRAEERMREEGRL